MYFKHKPTQPITPKHILLCFSNAIIYLWQLCVSKAQNNLTNVKLGVVDSNLGYFHLPTNALNLLNNKQQTNCFTTVCRPRYASTRFMPHMHVVFSMFQTKHMYNVDVRWCLHYDTCMLYGVHLYSIHVCHTCIIM